MPFLVEMGATHELAAALVGGTAGIGGSDGARLIRLAVGSE